LELYPKFAFSDFRQKNPQAMVEVKKFFLPISQSLGPKDIRDGLFGPNMLKFAKITAPYWASVSLHCIKVDQ